MNEKDWAGNGWTQYQKLVLAELERHSSYLEDLKKHISRLEIEIATLKVKSGVWGLVGGLIPVLIAIGIELLSKK